MAHSDENPVPPSMKGLIYHVDIVTSDFSKSDKFYNGFLGWLGYREIGYWKKEQGAGGGMKGSNVWRSRWRKNGRFCPPGVPFR